MPSEAIIVLGGATETDMLPPRAKLRVEKGVELYKEGEAPLIVMSGYDTIHATREPEQTEAEIMKAYAVSKGVPAEAIDREERSKDTFGNAYFIYHDFIKARSWKEVTIVTSAVHMPRVQYLFEKIVGDACAMRFEAAPDDPNRDDTEHEKGSFKIARKNFESVKPGDQQAVEAIYKRHTAYNPSDA